MAYCDERPADKPEELDLSSEELENLLDETVSEIFNCSQPESCEVTTEWHYKVYAEAA